MNVISDLKAMFERLGNPTARAEYRRLKYAEKLYLKAIKEAGLTYQARKIRDLRTSAETQNNDIKFSLKDSEGNALTEQQAEYFKDSKVRDENGNLLVVYHGSPSKFNEFSYQFMNTNGNAHGRGFYFTEDKTFAEGYRKGDDGQLLKGYLNIEKVASESNITMRKTDVVKLIKAICNDQAQYAVENDGYDSIQDALKDSFVSNYVDTYSAYSMDSVYREVADIVLRGSENDVDIIAELTNAAGTSAVLPLIKDTIGYDGIIFDNGNGTHQFITFASNQFKNVDNTNPTKKDDIRFSLKGSDKVMTALPNSSISFEDIRKNKVSTKEIKEQFKASSKEATESLVIATINSQAGLERVMRTTGIKNAEARTNFVRAGKNAASNVIAFGGGQYTLDGSQRVGDSWNDIWKPIKKDNKTYADFQLYLLHWHNIDRMAQGKPVFGEDVTAEDSRTAIAELEKTYPQFKKQAELVWKFLDNELQLRVDSGIYSQEYAETLRAMYPHYVPTYREEYNGGLAPIQGKSNIRINPDKKKAIGGDARILPIDEVVASQTMGRYASARLNKLLVDMSSATKKALNLG